MNQINIVQSPRVPEDIEKRRERQRRYYAKKYADEEFRKKEAERKAQWFQQPEVKDHRRVMTSLWRDREWYGRA